MTNYINVKKNEIFFKLFWYTVSCPLKIKITQFPVSYYLIQTPPGGGRNSHMKQTGMLVVSLRGVNFGFWSRLGCPGQSANILSRQGLV